MTINGRWHRKATFLGGAALLALVAITGSLTLEASPPEVAPLDFELNGPGTNVDDPCFWVDPVDPSKSLIFITTKSAGLVEVFRVVDGTLIDIVPGFQRPNNCAVVGDLLLTTDRDAANVQVHHLPDLGFVRIFGQDLGKPYGIDVFDRRDGAKHIFVTNEPTRSVHVYDLADFSLLRTFPTGLGDGIEPVLVDDHYERVYVARGENESLRGIAVFTPEGTPLGEFGRHLFVGDVEGLAIYACGEEGYLIASDQQLSATEFEIFDRVTLAHLGTFRLSDGAGDFSNATDGLDILQTPLPGFPAGILAVCDGCGDGPQDEMDVVGWDRIASTMGLNMCPDGIEPECLAVPCIEHFIVSADAYVRSGDPGVNFGAADLLEVEQDSGTSLALFRVEVPDLTGLEVLNATFRITVGSASSSGSDSGGTLFLSSGAWVEDQVTYATRPLPAGGPIGTAGPVAALDMVNFDVGDVVTTAGTYEFVLVGDSANKARYFSREANWSPPMLLLSVRGTNPPVLAISGPSSGSVVTLGAAVTLTAAATDPEDGDLSASILWRSDRDGMIGQGGTVTVPGLGAGAHAITAEVVDTSGQFASDTIALVVNVPPSVAITAPATGTGIAPGDPLSLEATASDAEDGPLEDVIEWTSSLDGALGTGGVVVASLTSGTHTLTASVVDADGARASAAVTVIANAAPQMVIVAPASGRVLEPRASLGLLGTASDAEDGDLTASIDWTSDRDGALGSGGSVTTTALVSSGVHQITARVTDAGGKSASAQVTVVVNATPTVAVTAPASGTEYEPGAGIVFMATANDVEDGDLAAAIQWTSDLDGTLGTGGTLSVATLGSGTHVVTAAVTDAGGKSASAQVTVVVNATPTVAVTAPASGTEYEPGAGIAFAATASDVEDGDLAAAIAWTSDLDGTLGTGSTLSVATLGSGTHVVTAAVTDAGGKSASAAVTVVVNATPTVTITAPADGATVLTDALPVLLQATAADAEDGDIGAGIRWTSSLDGPLGTGGSVPAILGVGAHVVTATATDAGGKSAQATVTLVIQVPNDPPAVTVTSPANGASFPAGTSVLFSGSATDDKDGDLSAVLRWTSSRDGILGIGSSVAAVLSEGAHNVSATALDLDGASGIVEIALDVTPTPPAVTIVRPTDGQLVQAGQTLTLTGSAADATDGDLSGALTWTSNLDGALGTGAAIEAGPLRQGTHVLTASVTDSSLLEGSTAVTVIVNAPPSIALHAPAAGAALLTDAPVVLAASAADAEDGDLADRIEWTSDVDGVLGSGETLVVTGLSAGAHVLTAAVMDLDGGAAAAAVAVTVRSSTLVIAVTADTYVDSSQASSILGQETSMRVDGSPTRQAFLRFAVGGVAPYRIGQARLRLTVGAESAHASTQAGTVHRITNGTWSETATRYSNRPAVDGPALATGGAAAVDAVVEFDVTAAVTTEGSYNFAIVTSSDDAVGYRTREAATGRPELVLRLTANNPPVVRILEPAAGASSTVGVPITLSATATDAEDGNLSAQIEWRSDLDGALGVGASVPASLSAGIHAVTAVVTDSQGLSSTSQRVVEVLSPPAVAITGPLDGTVVFVDALPLALSATAMDREDGDLGGEIDWTSDRDGGLGTGATIAASLGIGPHVIAATVTDSDGLTSVERISVLVRAANGAPQLTIDAPGTGTTVPAGTLLELAATAIDDFDGDLSGVVAWTSDLAGPLGVGASLQVALGEGSHVLTAGVVDSDGAAVTAQIAVGITPTPPTVTILSPADGAVVVEGTLLAFTGTAVDIGDGDLAAGLMWASDLDGVLGTGPTVAATLGIGRHTVTAVASDSGGLPAEASVVVTVNGRPEVDIHLPAPGAKLLAGRPVTMHGSAWDPEDGDLGAGIAWASSVDGPLGSGPAVTVAALSVGSHVLTATATDLSGHMAQATVDLTVVDGVLSIGAEADTYVDADQPNTAVGAETTARVDASPLRQILIRFRVPELAPLRIERAMLRLTGGPKSSHESQTGGTVHRISSTAWSEATTFNTRPAIDGPVLGMLGAVRVNQVVSVDVTAGVPGVGAHSFAIVTPDDDAAGYATREAPTGRPLLELTLGQNTKPVVRIVRPAPGSVVVDGDTVALAATGFDLEEGNLGGRIAWRSDLSGSLGSGEAIAVVLVPGMHTITAEVVDGGGLAGVAVTTVTVDRSPTLAIVQPASGEVFLPGEPVRLGATAADSEDGDLGAAIQWTSDLDGPLGSGASIDVTSLRLGTHGITASVLDAAGSMATDSTTVIVNAPPVVTVLLPAPGETVPAGSPVLLSGAASDPEDGDLTGAIVWSSDRDGLLGSGAGLSAALSAGLHLIEATVTDAFGIASRTGVALTVIDEPPTLTILAPTDGTMVDEGEMLLLSASALDRVDGNLGDAITWTSDLDGLVGTGALTSTSTLGPGQHQITASVTDGAGQVAAASVGVSVTATRTLTFGAVADAFAVETAPAARFGGSAHLIVSASPIIQVFVRFQVSGTAGLDVARAVVRLTADTSASAGSISGGVMHAVSDTGWQELLLTYNNRPPIDGPIVAAAGALNPGDVVDFDVTSAIDGDGTYVFAIVGAVVDSTVYQSREAGPNGPQLLLTTSSGSSDLPPSVTIQSPVEGAALTAGAPVTLTATASDARDGDLSSLLTWRSDVQGPLGVGASVLMPGLMPGTHVLTASVTDSGQHTGSDSKTVTVNGVPTVTIQAPASGTTVSAGVPLALNATASDVEDGDVSASLAWSSSLDGPLGNGAARTVTLSPGLHVIRAETTDTLGARGEAMVSLTVVDAPPMVTILEPAANTVSQAGRAVLLIGTALDTVDGDLGGSIAWSSDLDGLLGTGAALSISTLRVGTHAITAASTDANGGVGTARVNITVASSGALSFAAVADAFVVETAPSSRFGGSSHLIVNAAGPVIQAFLRFQVSGISGLSVQRAVVRLKVDGSASAGSSAGGDLYRLADTGWNELMLTYSNRPVIDGPLLHSAGPVLPGAIVEFDVTSAIGGNGTYVFAVVGTVVDSAVYRSREAGADGPQLVLVVE
jgi:myo-inositol-hexaphosphate 3-phosphohydrolase